MQLKKSNKIILIIFAVSIILRLLFLAVPSDMWHDASFTYVFSKEPVSYILDSNDVHPPLYYLFFKAILFISSNEMFLRGINIVFWALFFFGAYLYLSKNFSGWVTYLVLLFMSLSPTMIYYSVEPRNYMIGLFFVVMQLYFFFDEIYNEKLEKNFSWGFVIFSLLMLYTHYFTAFVLIIEFGFLIFKKDTFKRMVSNYVAIFLFTIPLFAYFLHTLPKIQAFWFKPSTFLGLVSTVSYQFVFGDTLNMLHLFVASCVLVAICYSLYKRKNNNLFPYIFFFLPVLILFIVNYSQVHAMYHHRFFLFYAIGLYIIIATALDNIFIEFPKSSLAVTGLICVCFLMSLSFTMTHPTQDLYDAQKFMKTQILPFQNVSIIHTASFSQTPFKYYFRDYYAKQLLYTTMNRKELFTAGGSVIKDSEIVNESEFPQHFYYLSDSSHPINDKLNATKIYDQNGLIIWKR